MAGLAGVGLSAGTEDFPSPPPSRHPRTLGSAAETSGGGSAAPSWVGSALHRIETDLRLEAESFSDTVTRAKMEVRAAPPLDSPPSLSFSVPRHPRGRPFSTRRS